MRKMSEIPLFCDTETYCEIPITDGTYKYASEVEVTLFPYAYGDSEVRVWDAANGVLHTNPMADDVYDSLNCEPSKEMPFELREGLEDTERLTVWQNSMFDRNVLRNALDIDLPTERIHDTMVIAAMHGLPMGLDKLCQVFGLNEAEAKDKDGRRLLMLFCKPRPKNMKLRRATRQTHPEDWAKFIKYACKDVVSMREIYKKQPKWNMTGNMEEQELWCLDQKINDRGFKVDVALAQKAMDAVAVEQKRLARRVQDTSKGMVEAATQRDVLLTHILLEHGVALPDMKKGTLERRLNDENLPMAVRELIAIRLEASTTSTSKYKKLVNGVNEDGRLRGTLQYGGAVRTLRWAGRTFQPQNLPRPTHDQEEIEFAIDMLMNDCLHLLSDETMKLTSSALRSSIITEEGNKLVVADLSNIEGRKAAWLAGETWKIKAFSDFDSGVGHDLYALAYARAFGITPEEVIDNKKNGDGSMRQVGKVMELALGYGGGVGAFVSMAIVYGMDLKQLAKKALPNIPFPILKKSEAWYETSKKNKQLYGLSKDVFLACDSLKRLWRESQNEIATYWWELEDCFRDAVETEGVRFQARKIYMARQGAWLKVRLPSGRLLCYPNCHIDEKGKLTYMGVNSYTRRWERISTYGGKIFENICQAAARDVLAANMQAVEDAGYPIVLTVHDELITETPDLPEYTVKELSNLMATVPKWAEGLPLAADGFEAYRYRK